MQTKKCTKCKEIKSIEEFCKHNGHADGYYCWCKKCSSLIKKLYYKNNSEEVKEYHKLYRENNPEKRREINKKYRNNNIEKVKETNKIWCENNIEKIKEYGKEYRENNSIEVTERIKKWRDNNPLKVLDIVHRRRAFLKGGISENIDFMQVYENLNWICGICGKKINKNLKHPNPKSVSLDHIIPISKDGNHIYSNVQPTHLFCNESKSNNINNIQLKIC